MRVLVLLLALFCSMPCWASPQRGMTVTQDLTVQDLGVLAAWKVKVIRYPLQNLEADTQSKDEYFTWLQEQLPNIDTLRTECARLKIQMILDLHTPPGGFYSYDVKTQHRVFSEVWAREALLEAWDLLTHRYKGKAGIYAFDLLNEPAQREVASGLTSWTNLAPKLAKRIRAIDKNRRLIVEPLYGDPSQFTKLKKLALKNITYSFHMYYPLYFQHQGLYGNPLGVNYPDSSRGLNKAKLVRTVKYATDYAKKNKVQMYVGEFSAIRWAPGSSAVRYLKDAIDIFESHKWDWTYHAFRESDAWSVEHGAVYMDPTLATAPTDRLLLLKKYFKKK